MPDGWCSMHATVVDENGWREDWPEQDKLIEFIASHEGGVKSDPIVAHFPDFKPADVRKALNRLRFGGTIDHCFGSYKAKGEPVKKPRFTMAELLSLFPLGYMNAETILQCQRRAMETYGLTKSQFNDLRFNFMTEGKIQRDDTGQYYRPSVDDIRANKTAK